MVDRRLILGLATLLLGAGCHAGNSGLKRQDSPVAKEAISKARIIAQHNKNASTIQSLKASPSIVVSDGKNSGRLGGRMAMEREKDFRLEIATTMQIKQADIGSNAKGFWFWVNGNQEKAIYVCDYDHVNASPLAVTMRPDWIMESMGLREISEREAATIGASKGDKPGQLVLTQLRNDPKGGTLTKLTIVDESTGEILEHRLYSGAKDKLLAQATISQTQEIKMGSTESDPDGSVVRFPMKIKLQWFVENLTLDMTMSQLSINYSFDKEQRTALFTEPPIKGTTRVDLARLNAPPASSSSRIHETAPRSGGIRLGKPESAEPIGVEGAMGSPREVPTAVAELSNPASRPATYVGPPVPVGADPEAVQASGRSGGWGRSTFNR